MKNIKRNITRRIILICASSFFLITPAFAASVIVLTPNTVNTAPEKIFTITVAVDSQGTKNYAEKIELTYPADILEVKSFSLANGWMALTQSGYDLIDNINGVIIKSAGLPSGLSSQTTFGTITFSAKKAGSGTIKIGGNSLAFEASTQNSLSGAGTFVTITSPTALPVTEPVAAVTPVKSTTKSPVVTVPSISPKATEPVIKATSSNEVASVTSSGFNWNWLWLLVIAVLFLPGIYYSLRGNKKV